MSVYENQGSNLPGVEASGDLSANQFHFVKLDSNGQAELCGEGDGGVGVLQNKPDAAGKAATIWGPGSVSKVVAGATVTAGVDVAADANGEAVTSTSGDYIFGQAITGGDAGEYISVFLTMPGRTA